MENFIQQTLNQDKLLKLNTKLWLAIKNNQLEKVKDFLEQGATLHKISGVSLRRYDLDENTPLHLAAKLGFIEIVELLLEYTSEVDARNRLKQTPLQWAAYYSHLDVVKYLVSKGADVHTIDADGDPALTWAANKAQFKVVDYLIQQGADPKKISPIGNTALHWVAIAGEVKMAQHLLDLGCDPLLKNQQGSTALDLAIENAHTDMVTLLTAYLK